MTFIETEDVVAHGVGGALEDVESSSISAACEMMFNLLDSMIAVSFAIWASWDLIVARETLPWICSLCESNTGQ